MTTLIEVGDQQIEVTFKRIKNVHLSVKPPNGDVFVSAPIGMKVSAVRAYALTKLAWINKHRGACASKKENLSANMSAWSRIMSGDTGICSK